jgi:N-hydroxyarylamine O-acetyltransferase
MIDLEAYFTRIGYTGEARADLATLRALHQLHPAAIPFENLDPLLERPVPLDLDDLQRKLVANRRGGYCFEQNNLFMAVLEAIGFSVTGLLARVRWNLPPGAPPNPRTHMALKVDLPEGSFIADVGFGGMLQHEPLLLARDGTPPIKTGLMHFVRDEEGFTLQAGLPSGVQDLYRFTLEPQFLVDFELSNWYTATHPQSRFRNNLLMERLTPKIRVSLFNRKVTRRFPDGRAEVTSLASPAELAELLAVDFQIDAPADAQIIFARLPA